MDSPNIFIDQNHLRKSPETICVTPIHWATEKIPILKQVRKDETYSGINPTPGTVPEYQERISNPQYLPGEGNGTPLQYSCLENLMGGGAW